MAKNNFKISVVIGAVDKVTARMRLIQSNLNRSLAPIEKVQKKLGNMWKHGGGEKLSKSFANLREKASAFGQEFKQLASTLMWAGGAAAAAVSGIAYSTAKWGDGVAILADKTGISIVELQKLQYAAQRSDVEVETFNQGLLNMSKALGQAKAGTGKLNAFLKKTNPAFLQQMKATKGNGQALLTLVNAMKAVEDPAKRLALAQAAFGGAGQDMVNLVNSNEGFAALVAEAERMNIAIGEDGVLAASKFEDTLTKLFAVVTAIKNKIGVQLIGVLQKYADQLIAWASTFDFEKLGRSIASFVDTVIPMVMNLTKAIMGFFFTYDEATGKFEARTGNIRLAMLALGAIIMGPLLASLAAMTVAFVQLGIAIGLTPIGWLAAALMGLIAVGALVWAYWDDIAGFFGRIFDWLCDKLGWLLDATGSLLSKLPKLPGIGAAAESKFKVPSYGPASAGPMQATAALQKNQPTMNESLVKVDFMNIPKGTKVKTEKSPGMGLDLGMKYGPMLAN